MSGGDVRPACDECGTPMEDGGPCGWYCPSDAPHPKHDEWVRKMVYDNGTVPRRDHDAAVARLEREKAAAVGLVEGHALTIARLEAQCEELRKDAERYRWLRSGQADDGKAGLGSRLIRMGHGAFSYELPAGDDLDTAIDAQQRLRSQPCDVG